MSEPKGISRLSDESEPGVQVPFKVQPVRWNYVVKALRSNGFETFYIYDAITTKEAVHAMPSPIVWEP